MEGTSVWCYEYTGGSSGTKSGGGCTAGTITGHCCTTTRTRVRHDEYASVQTTGDPSCTNSDGSCNTKTNAEFGIASVLACIEQRGKRKQEYEELDSRKAQKCE